MDAMTWQEWRGNCLRKYHVAEADAMLYYAVREMEERLNGEINLLKEKVNQMSQGYSERSPELPQHQGGTTETHKIHTSDGPSTPSAPAPPSAAIESDGPGPASATDGGAKPPSE